MEVLTLLYHNYDLNSVNEHPFLHTSVVVSKTAVVVSTTGGSSWKKIKLMKRFFIIMFIG